MPAKYVRPYSRGQKNDFRDAEAIAEAVQRPTIKFVATKTAEQLDLQALHRVRESSSLLLAQGVSPVPIRPWNISDWECQTARELTNRHRLAFLPVPILFRS
jgi:hypothetical protein